jgi:hypothetical protein
MDSSPAWLSGAWLAEARPVLLVLSRRWLQGRDLLSLVA